MSATISQENAWPTKVLILSIVSSSFCMSWPAQKNSHPDGARMADGSREDAQAFFGAAVLAPKKWFTAMRRLT